MPPDTTVDVAAKPGAELDDEVETAHKPSAGETN